MSYLNLMVFRVEISPNTRLVPVYSFPIHRVRSSRHPKLRSNVTVFPGAKEVDMGFDQPQAGYGRLLGLEFVPRFPRGCLWAIMQ